MLKSGGLKSFSFSEQVKLAISRSIRESKTREFSAQQKIELNNTLRTRGTSLRVNGLLI